MSAEKVIRNKLTRIEDEFIRLYANGFTAKEIAHVAETTQVRVQVSMVSLKHRFAAKNTTHLIYILMRRGLLK